MIPLDSYPNIPDSFTLAQAISEIAGWQIERKGKFSLPRILLVFNEDDHLVGMLRRRDIMRGLLPRFLASRNQDQSLQHFDLDLDLDLELAELFKDKDHKHLKRNAETPVSVVMQPIEGTIDADADLMDLIREMVPNEAHILPVTENDHVIGVVRTVELLNQIRRMLEL